MPKPEKRELDASSKAGVVPAKAAKLGSEGSAKTMGSGGSGGGQASAPTHKKPRLPSASGADKDSPAHPILKHIIPYVNQELEIYLRTEKTLKENEHLVNLLPLTIESVEKAGVSYKHHWLPTSCKKSMEQSGMYEAGGVLFWIDPETTGSFLIPAVQPTWSSVCSVADNQFNAVGVSGSNNATTRIVFPVPLSAKWDGPISADTYPTRLTILGGHAFIWAWYVKMFHALDGREKNKIQELVECALTVTLCVWQNLDTPNAALESMKSSETIRTAAKVMVDSFITFQDKVMLVEGVEVSGSLAQTSVAPLQKKNVRFNGSLINVSMIKSMNGLKGMLTTRARELLALIENRFGFDVLTGSYNKLRMLTNGCAKVGASGFEWCLETMYMSMLRGNLDASDFRTETFLKGKDGSPSWISVALTQKEVVEHLVSIAQGVAKVDPSLSATLQEKVTRKTAGPLLYHESFPNSTSVVGVADDDEDGQQENDDMDGEEPADLVGELGSCSCRGAILLAEAFRKTFDGSWDDALNELCSHASCETALTNLDADTLKAPMLSDFKELLRSLHAAENVVKASGVGLPQPSLRSLVRNHSDGADAAAAEAERADVWRRAQAQRKKKATLALVKDGGDRAAKYQDILKKRGGDINKFTGRPGEEHRLFVVSADLLACNGTEPWKNISTVDDNVLSPILTFLSGCRGVGDVTLAFDGCVRTTRRKLEDDLFANLQGYSEIFAIYSESWNASFKKKILFGSENCEVGYISMPTSRTRIPTQERQDLFNASGETTSHFKTLSGVKIAARMSLPRIGTEDKQKIFPDTPSTLPKKWIDAVSSGQPLFWQETKTKDFWVGVLGEAKIKSCVDTSPGSGQLAVACMELGVDYFGICRDATHLAWLGNVLDRAALTYVCEAGAHLYQEDLAEHVKELFAEMLKDGEEDEPTDDVLQSSDDES